MDTRTVFVLNGASQGRSYTMESRGFELLFGALSIVMDRFRVAGRLDDGGIDDRLNLYAEVDCGDVGFYGAALDLLGMCNAATGLLVANGTAVLSPHPGAGGTRIDGLSATVTLVPGAGGTGGIVEATFAGTEVPSIGHLPVVVLVDPATGEALECRYGANTERVVAADGRLAGVRLAIPEGIDARGKDAIVTVDLFPVARVRLPAPG
jgi:hypothetical protein